MPVNDRRGRPQGKCHREQTAGQARFRAATSQARVKRWGKSPPRDRQRKRHGKPHREQDQIGAARRATGTRVSAPSPGSVARGARQRASQRNGHPSPPRFAWGRGQNPAYRPSDPFIPQRGQAVAAPVRVGWRATCGQFRGPDRCLFRPPPLNPRRTAISRRYRRGWDR